MLVAAFLIGTVLTAEVGIPLAEAETLQRAEKEFREGVRARERPGQARPHFQAAFADYEALRRHGANNPDLYRNQGNAAYLANDLPAAILAYRRGLRLDPGDRALQANLESARDQIQYPTGSLCRPAADEWPPWLPRPSENLLLGLAVGLYTLGCVAKTRWLMVRRAFLLHLAAVAILLACLVGFRWGIGQWQTEQESHPLVVVKDAAPLRTGNGNAYPPHKGLPSVSRGMEGRLQFVRGDWLQVEFVGGDVGWLRRDRVLVDTP